MLYVLDQRYAHGVEINYEARNYSDWTLAAYIQELANAGYRVVAADDHHVIMRIDANKDHYRTENILEIID